MTIMTLNGLVIELRPKKPSIRRSIYIYEAVPRWEENTTRTSWANTPLLLVEGYNAARTKVPRVRGRGGVRTENLH
jgi:hypothetical protein